MLTSSFRISVYTWFFNGDPDNDVHNSFGTYADSGDHFINFNTGQLFVCMVGGVGSQEWNQITDVDQVNALIAAIPQSDWTQANVSLPDYIKNKPSLSTVATSGAYADLSGKPSLATVATSGSYNDLSNKPSIPAAQIQSDWTQASSGSLDFIKNKPSIPAAQIQSDWTQSSSGAVDFIKNKPAARSQSSASRSLNSAFQVSASRDSLVNYSVDIGTSLSLTTGQTGTVFLEIASDSGFTTNVQELARFVNGNGGTLTIGLALTQNVTGTLSGYVPSAYYVRIRTANTVSTPTFTYRSGQEVLI